MGDPLVDSFTSIMHLPDDCLSFIFQRLDCSCDRESFGRTCHRWLNIQNLNRRSLQFECSFRILKPSTLSQCSMDINSRLLQTLLSRFQNLECLSLSGCTELTDSGLTHLQYYGSRLQELYLDCCFRLTDMGISLIASGCPSVAVISLYRCNVTDVGLRTLSSGCSTLKRINLSYCSIISDLGLKALVQRCHHLQVIKVSNCSRITGVGFQGCLPTLFHIDAESCRLEPEGIEGIVSGGGVEFLNLSGMSFSIYGNGMASIGKGFALSLKILNLRQCRAVGDESIAAIAKGCPVLKEWNLALCHEVRISGWESIGLNSQNLEKLHVNRCRNLCNRGLQSLRNGCKQLSVLYIGHNTKLSDTAVELFRLYRSSVELRGEEKMFIGPDWNY